MLFYLYLYLLCMGRLETVLKGVYIIRKKDSCTLAIYLCLVLLCSLDLFLSLSSQMFYFLGFALLYVCTDFFSQLSIDYFKNVQY